MKKSNVIIILLLLIGQVGFCQQDSLAKKQMEMNFRQFDFWIGEWNVYNANTNKLVGINTIESILGGKAIRETYATANGKYEGTSISKFNPRTQKWEQYWVDNGGLTLHIIGGIVDGKMVLQNEEKTAKGTTENRITWTPNQDGTVRQQWDVRTDKQKKWQSAFDGIYKKAKK